MKKACMCFLSVFVLTFLCTYGVQEGDAVKKIGRLLVNIEPGASFSPREFSQAANAQLVDVDARNPFVAFNDIYLDSPFVVLSTPVPKKKLGGLSERYGYRYASFFVESLEQAVLEAGRLLDSMPKTSSDILPMSSVDSEKIYDLMQKADKVFTENNLTYWATAGTLLGAIRHQGLIPWDDDLDICIFEQDEERLKEMKEALNNVGLDLYYYVPLDMYKISPLDGLPIENVDKPGTLRQFTFPYLDVFVMALDWRREFEDVYVHRAKGFYKNFNQERFRYSQIEGIYRVPFGPLSIPIPGDPEDFLNANYGTRSYPGLWKEYAVEPVWNHKLDAYISGGTALVELD